MTRRSALREHCGFFAIGVEGGKYEANIGSLWRSADLFGAAFIFTVGARYRKQPSGTMRSARHIPLFGFGSVDDLYAHLPVDASLVAVELTDDARDLVSFVHPEQACYVLGAEDVGLSRQMLDRCSAVVKIPGRHSMNVACAGSITMYSRYAQIVRLDGKGPGLRN